MCESQFLQRPLTAGHLSSISSLQCCRLNRLTKHYIYVYTLELHSLSPSLTHARMQGHNVLTTCHQHWVWVAQKRTHTLFLHSVLWLTRWFVLFLRPRPIRAENTNLSPQVMLKAAGHYLLAISVLTSQTDSETRLWQEDTTAVTICVRAQGWGGCSLMCAG